jgi:hypothetical protein
MSIRISKLAVIRRLALDMTTEVRLPPEVGTVSSPVSTKINKQRMSGNELARVKYYYMLTHFSNQAI